MKHQFKFKKGDTVILNSVPESMDIKKAGHEYKIVEVKFDSLDGLHYGIFNKEQCYMNYLWYVGEDNITIKPHR